MEFGNEMEIFITLTKYNNYFKKVTTANRD